LSLHHRHCAQFSLGVVIIDLVESLEFLYAVVDEFLEFREEHLIAVLASVGCHVRHQALAAHQFPIIIDWKYSIRDERDKEW
jgi:hypothetical protein